MLPGCNQMCKFHWFWWIHDGTMQCKSPFANGIDLLPLTVVEYLVFGIVALVQLHHEEYTLPQDLTKSWECYMSMYNLILFFLILCIASILKRPDWKAETVYIRAFQYLITLSERKYIYSSRLVLFHQHNMCAYPLVLRSRAGSNSFNFTAENHLNI